MTTMTILSIITVLFLPQKGMVTAMGMVTETDRLGTEVVTEMDHTHY